MNLIPVVLLFVALDVAAVGICKPEWDPCHPPLGGATNCVCIPQPPPEPPPPIIEPPALVIAAAIPTLGEWAVIGLAAALGIAGLLTVRGRNKWK